MLLTMKNQLIALNQNQKRFTTRLLRQCRDGTEVLNYFMMFNNLESEWFDPNMMVNVLILDEIML